MKLYQRMSQIISAYHNCIRSQNTEWETRHKETIESLANDYLPSGSGIDSGCQIDIDNSNQDKIIIQSSYHRMDDNGMYDGWIDFTVTVKPSLCFNYVLSIRGNGITKYDLGEYLHSVFSESLEQEIIK